MLHLEMVRVKDVKNALKEESYRFASYRFDYTRMERSAFLNEPSPRMPANIHIIEFRAVKLVNGRCVPTGKSSYRADVQTYFSDGNPDQQLRFASCGTLKELLKAIKDELRSMRAAGFGWSGKCEFVA
jgi:hypothetical protein